MINKKKILVTGGGGLVGSAIESLSIEYPDYCNFINITESPQDIVKFIKHKILK